MTPRQLGHHWRGLGSSGSVYQCTVGAVSGRSGRLHPEVLIAWRCTNLLHKEEENWECKVFTSQTLSGRGTLALLRILHACVA